MNQPEQNPLAIEAASIDTPLGRLNELARIPALTALVAANPATASETLERLAQSKEKAVRQAVAQNPNTPIRQLVRLAREFPQEFLSNPILPLLNISQPNFIKEFDAGLWLQLLRTDQIPPAWVKALHQGHILASWQAQEALEEARLHIAVAGEATSRWKKQASEALQKDRRLFRYLYTIHPDIFLLCILVFPALGTQWSTELYWRRKEIPLLLLAHCPELDGSLIARLARNPEIPLRCAAARHPRAPAKVLSKLADGSQAAQVRRAVASNPGASVKLLRRLAGDSEASVRQATAHHPRLTLELLEVLALDPDPTVRAAAALHPKLSLVIYQLLAEDVEPEVRAALARNVHAPRETLLALAQDAIPEVRIALARNPRLPAEAFTLLFQDTQASVRPSLASNPRLPLPLLEQLAADPDPDIRRGLAANPRTPQELLESWFEEATNKEPLAARLAQPLFLLRKPNQSSDKALLLALARNPRATPALLTRLAQYHSGKFQSLIGLRAAVAAHKHTPVETLRWLAGQQERPIQEALASNPHTPLEVLKQTLSAANPKVWARIAHHPAVLRDQRRILSALLMEKISKDRAATNLPFWFIYPFTELPESRMSDSVNSTFWQDRFVVACQEKAPQAILEALRHDGNRFVRAAARSTLIKRARATSHTQKKTIS